ncbi:super-infection exclusion protein B [Acinetobacter indicus]|uniref:super-infection exclusion protein B n=1 Tax=Acinetobacter indicus TaxID=756892 RepID=UPI0039894F67
MEYIKSFLDIFRTHNVLLYVVCITTAFLSYNIFGAADLTGYTNIKSEYKNYTGLVFFLSAITISILIARSLYKFISNCWNNSRLEKLSEDDIKQKIKNLSNKEKAVLLQFFIQQSETIWLPFQAQEVAELINSNLIYVVNNMSRITQAGHALLMKLSRDNMILLAQEYPDIFSSEFNQQLINDLVQKHTPASVIAVIKSGELHGY